MRYGQADARGSVNARDRSALGIYRQIKRELADGRALADRRYRDGDCTVCGEPLDDVSLAGGYAICGDCEQV